MVCTASQVSLSQSGCGLQQPLFTALHVEFVERTSLRSLCRSSGPHAFRTEETKALTGRHPTRDSTGSVRWVGSLEQRKQQQSDQREDVARLH